MSRECGNIRRFDPDLVQRDALHTGEAQGVDRIDDVLEAHLSGELQADTGASALAESVESELRRGVSVPLHRPAAPLAIACDAQRWHAGVAHELEGEE